MAEPNGPTVCDLCSGLSSPIAYFVREIAANSVTSLTKAYQNANYFAISLAFT